MLRKVRREGLSPEQLAALGGSSRIDDSEVRATDSPPRARRQPASRPRSTRSSSRWWATTSPAPARANRGARHEGKTPPPILRQTTTRAAVIAHAGAGPRTAVAGYAPQDAPLAPPPRNAASSSRRLATGRCTAAGRLRPPVTSPAPFSGRGQRGRARPGTRRGGDRLRECRFRPVRTGVVGSDRASAARAPSTPRPGWCCSTCTAPPASSTSSKAWHSTTRSSSAGPRRSGISLPKLVAESAQQDKPRAPARGRRSRLGLPRPSGHRCRGAAAIGVPATAAALGLRLECPEDGRCRGRDAPVRSVPPLGRRRRWTCAGCPASDFLAALQDAAPTGVRDADPAYWVLRLDALRLANRPDQFDEAAIDYCVTYEVSPPSWERAKCHVRIGGAGLSTQSPPLSQVGDVATSFVESPVDEHSGTVTMASVELSGQLVGDISATLKQLDSQLADCAAGHGVLHQVDPRRLHRRRRPAQLGAGQTQREPQRDLRRFAPPGCPVLWCHGHQRARQRARAHQLATGPNRRRPRAFRAACRRAGSEQDAGSHPSLT